MHGVIHFDFHNHLAEGVAPGHVLCRDSVVIRPALGVEVKPALTRFWQNGALKPECARLIQTECRASCHDRYRDVDVSASAKAARCSTARNDLRLDFVQCEWGATVRRSTSAPRDNASPAYHQHEDAVGPDSQFTTFSRHRPGVLQLQLRPVQAGMVQDTFQDTPRSALNLRIHHPPIEDTRRPLFAPSPRRRPAAFARSCSSG